MKKLNLFTWMRRVRYPKTPEGRKRFIQDSLKTDDLKTVTVYANPISKTGFPARAEILEVLHDHGRLIYCKVKMIDSGIICKKLIHKSEFSNPSKKKTKLMKWLFAFMILIGSVGFITTLIFVIANKTVSPGAFTLAYIFAILNMIFIIIGTAKLSDLEVKKSQFSQETS